MKSYFSYFGIVLLTCLSCNTNPSAIEKQDYLKGELPVQEGMVLFNQHCSSCHNFSSNEIGPNLSGITSSVDKAWLKAFIQNAQKMIAEGDPRAVAQFEKFGVFMPSFPQFSEDDLERLLGFIHKFSEGEKRNLSNRKGGLVNPIPQSIDEAEFTLVLEEFATLPPSSEQAPVTRINTLRALTTEKKERLFISDLRGILYEIEGAEAQPYLAINTALDSFIDRPGLGSGLGSFAFHPDFEQNGLLYTTHTEPPQTKPADFATPEGAKATLQWVLTEWETKTPTVTPFSGTHRELLRIDMITGIHGCQELTFNPTAEPSSTEYGMLYLGIGDGGAALAGHPEICGRKEYLWGSVIRIDPKGTNSTNGKYGIPPDNPFVGDATGLPEIWSMGFRNPHRISWDSTGSRKMLVSNIGQHSVEEVNLVVKGGHYGWPFREGSFLFDVDANPEMVYSLPEEETPLFINPVIEYDHDEGNAVSGGFVYGGKEIPALYQKYLFGDIPRGTFFVSPLIEIQENHSASIQKVGIQIEGNYTSLQAVRPNERVDLRFGKGHRETLYVFTKSNGKVYRVSDFKPKITE